VLAALDQEFRANAQVLRTPPTRFYLNLSELCQLRCTHCITSAPELTASGAARSMTAPVLDRLRPHLRHAAYVGFTHAGEPMIAPLFEPVLDAIAEERRGQPTRIHLLSNGVALTPARFAELVSRGVSSFSISIDGMSAATNDVLRVGSRIADLLPRIEELCRIKPASVRLGIAWTVSASNAREIPGLLSFARTAGVDWVKLEEMYPINLQARLEMPKPPDLTAAVDQALALATMLGLPLLDHTENREVYKCHLDDPATARFSELDDFANRMEINPCRLPLEVVCVEPNGDVKPVSFHHDSGGNLLERDLLDIWNGDAFRRARARVLERRLCGAGPVVCPADPGPEKW
jgi:MoaA/NifB/PqqE/SkfB family radical SAM enzyme